jgi:ATP/maltotriose-dependent transcriptional regulator MalT
MILERDGDLRLLRQLLGDLESSGGRVVLVRGEAGIGKSALIAEFLAEIEDRAHVLLGACDDLLTPQPLGPVWDIARHDPAVAASLSRGDRRAVMEVLLDLLSRRLRPTVLVFEDTQWADEATLDVIKFLGRRIARSNGVLILTYRDGAVDTNHPLRQVIGDLPPQNVARVQLAHLTGEAIRQMIEGKPFDVGEVLSLTGGNPLFVSEVIASGIEAVPSSVQDSVLARASKLPARARKILDLVCIAPGHLERSLVEEILDPTQAELRECARHGLLRVDDETLSFRHELQRRAIESSLSAADRRQLNKQVLTALAGSGDLSRLVHHAREADDVESIIEFAPEAGRAAVAIESHREAVAHFRTLEPYLGRIVEVDRAAIIDDWARAEFYLDNNAESLDLLGRAIELHRCSSADRALARTLAFAVRVNEMNGRPDEAEACSVEAVSILEPYPPSADLAFAVSQQAWLRLMRGDDDLRGIELADRAIAIAEGVGDDLTVTRALVYKGAIGHSSADRSAASLVEEAHRRAELGGYRHEEVYALLNLAGLAADAREVERAADLAQRARGAAARYEIRPLEIHVLAMYAEILLWKGDWTGAEDAATEVLGSHSHAETIALRMLGTLQARRGRPEARATLDRMWSLAEASGELQHLDPAGSALAEYMWLSGEDDPDRIVRLHEILDRGMQSGFSWPSGAFAFWAWKLGILATIPDRLVEFYRWIIEGDWQAAADFWEARGVPYERALALMHGDDDAQIQAIRICEELGATVTANRIRRVLLDKGVRVPRGVSRSTREHSAGLTARQAEVLELLAGGLANAEIADRLFVSYRTVENHVAAILMKFDVPTRDAAVDAARDRGILAPRDEPQI